MSTLSEATKETPTGKIHTADPGGYGRKDDEETDDDGNSKKVKPASTGEKRGKGRPPKAGPTGSKPDWSAFGATGKDIKLPKWDKKKTTKHSLKDWIEHTETALNEGESTVHKAGPGGYGNRHGVEDVTDQYGKPIGRASLSKMSDAPAVKRGKGRPPKAADASGEVKSYDSSALSKAMGMGKAPKTTGKASFKHRIKEQGLDEEELTVKPMPGASQIMGPDGKSLGTADAATANTLKQAAAQGKLTLGGISTPKPGAGIGMSEAKKATKAKPDFLDVDKDDDKKEPFKKAVKDKEAKKKVDESVLYDDAGSTFDHVLSKFKHEVKNFEAGGDLDNDLYEALFDYYSDLGEIPYGVAKARDGDPYEWVTQRLHSDLGLQETMMAPVVASAVKPAMSIKPAMSSKPIGFGNPAQPQNPFAFESEKMKDIQLESWESQLNSLLTEGITVSSSTGQQGSPDSVSVNATDADAQQLLDVLRQAGVGVFGGQEKPMSQYGAPMQPGAGPEGNGEEPEVAPAVVDDGDGMMALMKKMAGIESGGEQQPSGTMAVDYADEEGDEGQEQTSGDFGSDEEGSEEGADDSEEEQGEEEVTDESMTDEGNAFGGAVAKAKSDNIPDEGQKFKVGGNEYPVKEEGEEEAACESCGHTSCECDSEGEEQVEEGYANSDDDKQMYDFKRLLSMGNDMHHQKRTQATGNIVPVTMGDRPMRESTSLLSQLTKLSGIK